MKKLITVDENEGLTFLLEKQVMIFCMNYIYSGFLSCVSETFILLKNAGIVYETGPLNSKEFKDFQKLPYPIYISINSIESFCEIKKT
jgi:hypothetical protein